MTAPDTHSTASDNSVFQGPEDRPDTPANDRVSCYETLFATESGVDGAINCAIETFGAVTDRQEVQFPSSELQECLDTLHGGDK